MKIHEYQGRQLLASFGIPVPAGTLVESVEQAATTYKQVAAEAGTDLVVVKAQVHAGGRGKAGFVKLVRSAKEAEEAARFMLTHRMVSVQTGPEGLEVTKLLFAAGVDIADRPPSAPLPHGPSAPSSKEEFYLAITTDRATRRNVLIASREGGVDIETVAHDRPDAIIKEPLHPLMGLQPHQARRVAFELGFKGSSRSTRPRRSWPPSPSSSKPRTARSPRSTRS
jgi:succinyl-CoA synthetase beta subunit